MLSFERFSISTPQKIHFFIIYFLKTVRLPIILPYVTKASILTISFMSSVDILLFKV